MADMLMLLADKLLEIVKYLKSIKPEVKKINDNTGELR